MSLIRYPVSPYNEDLNARIVIAFKGLVLPALDSGGAFKLDYDLIDKKIIINLPISKPKFKTLEELRDYVNGLIIKFGSSATIKHYHAFSDEDYKGFPIALVIDHPMTEEQEQVIKDYENWLLECEEMRKQERKNQNISNAIRVLEAAGYNIVENNIASQEINL